MPRAGVWLQEGEGWIVGLDGSRTFVRDSKGMRHLAQLLARPAEEVSALELVGAEEGSVAAPAHAGTVLDERAKAEYRNRLEALAEQIARAERVGDAAGSASARAEFDFLAREVKAGVGLGGRDRLLGSNVERARLNVTRSIRSAIERIARQDERLAEHLHSGVRTGAFCVYEPDRDAPVEWRNDHAEVASAPAAEPVLSLPVPATPLFGRERDVERVTALLRDPAVRLVTLVGPGGVGKTRLALEAAREAAADFAGGVRFVELAGLSDAREAPDAIRTELGVSLLPGDDAVQALVRALGERRVLLVLDNVEQLLPAAAQLVGELLEPAPGLRLLVTSREATRLRAERVHPVLPLEVPPVVRDAARAIRAYPGVALFCERAQARDPRFAPDEDDLRAIAEICRRLDGMPLALELAAARVGVLTPAELAGRLDHALSALGKAPADAPDRHMTLRATIDWSYGLLNDAERRLFARMSVFRSGATLPVAETVAAASLDELDSLVAKHLITRRGDRLAMLETVREYGQERLFEDSGAEDVWRRLARWAVELFRGGAPRLNGVERVEWLARLDPELPNAVAALEWATERDDVLAVELAVALAEYWYWTDRFEEGSRRLAGLAAIGSTEVPATLRAGALMWRERLLPVRDPQRSVPWLEESLALFRAAGDDPGTARALSALGMLLVFNGEEARAQELMVEWPAVAERCSDPAIVAQGVRQAVQISADFDSAVRLAEGAIATLEAAGHLLDLSQLCSNVGYLALAQERDRESIPWLERAVAAARKAGGAGADEMRYVLIPLSNLGLARLFTGDHAGAAATLGEALAMSRGVVGSDVVTETILAVAVFAARSGKHADAARLTGTAHAHLVQVLSPIEQRVWERLVTMVEAIRGEAGYFPVAEGEALSLDEAVELALSLTRR